MNKASTLLAGCLFSFASLLAQNATLRGTVAEAETGTPLLSATVQSGGGGTITDLDGTFELRLPEGEHAVTVSYVGYETKTETVFLKAGESKTLDFALAESNNILETATVTSGKHERALGEVTVSLDVIKPQLLQNTNQTSLNGLLDKIPGVNFVGDQANIRGGSGFSYGAGSRVLLLVDDIPILQADAGFPQWEDVPLENIEQVEVVKGAASALYGSSALNGIINVRTAYAKSKPETKIAPFYGIYLDPKDESTKWQDDKQPYAGGLSVSHKRKIGKFDLVLGGYYFNQNSVNDSSFSRRLRWNGNFRYRVTDRFSVGVNTNFNKSKGSSFFYWGGLDSLLFRPGVPVGESSNLRFNIDPYAVYFDKSDNRHKLQGRFFSVENQSATRDADQSNVSDVYYGEYQFQRKMESIGLIATAGLVYIGTKVRAPLYGDTVFTSRNMAGYLQLDKKILKRVNLSGGFRFERNVILTPEVLRFERPPLVFTDTVPGGKLEESKPVFRMGMSYQASKTTFLRASFGQGYRFPTIAEKFIFTQFGTVPISPNLDLTSETGWSAEIGLRKGFALSKFSGFLDLAAFWSEYQDMMEFTFVDLFSTGFQSQNVGDTRIKGFEVSVTGRGVLFGLQTNLLTGYTFVDPKFQEFGLDLPEGSEGRKNAENSSICSNPEDCKNILKYRQRHSFKFDLESTFKKFTLGFGANYNSNMENIDAIFELLVVPGLKQFRQEHDGGDLILSARAACQFSKNVKASLVANNLTNREYSDRPGLLQPTRNVTLRLDFDF